MAGEENRFPFTPRRIIAWVGVRSELDRKVHQVLSELPSGENESEFIKKCIAGIGAPGQEVARENEYSEYKNLAMEIEKLRQEYQGLAVGLNEIRQNGMQLIRPGGKIPVPEIIEAVNVKEKELEEKLNNMGNGW
jgi:hypothetical protein